VLVRAKQFRDVCRVLTASPSTGGSLASFRTGSVAPAQIGENGSLFRRRRHPLILEASHALLVTEQDTQELMGMHELEFPMIPQGTKGRLGTALSVQFVAFAIVAS
jgi:hypothetical protein